MQTAILVLREMDVSLSVGAVRQSGRESYPRWERSGYFKGTGGELVLYFLLKTLSII